MVGSALSHSVRTSSNCDTAYQSAVQLYRRLLKRERHCCLTLHVLEFRMHVSDSRAGALRIGAEFPGLRLGLTKGKPWEEPRNHVIRN